MARGTWVSTLPSSIASAWLAWIPSRSTQKGHKQEIKRFDLSNPWGPNFQPPFPASLKEGNVMLQVCKAWKSISRMSKNKHLLVYDTPFVDNTPDELYLPELFEAKEQLSTPTSVAETRQMETKTCTDTTSSGTTNIRSHTAAQQTSRDTDPSLSDCRERREPEETAMFFPLTQTIPTHTKESEKDGGALLERAEVDTSGRFSAKSSTCLVGLHSCGDLGGVALRLFLRQPQLNALCVVGCCYHHITEEHESGGWSAYNFTNCSNGVLFCRMSRISNELVSSVKKCFTG